MHPLFGVILVSVALVYLTILAFQVCKQRNNGGQQFESTDDSGYTDLSCSDSSKLLQRHDLEQLTDSNTVPNTCSYNESQLQTPCQSVTSMENRSATNLH